MYKRQVRVGNVAGAATLSVIYNSSGGDEVIGVIAITVASTSSLTFTAPSVLNVRIGQTIGINARLYASDGANAIACDVATGIVGGITVASPVGCSYRVTAGNTVGVASFVVPYASSNGRTLSVAAPATFPARTVKSQPVLATEAIRAWRLESAKRQGMV